MKTANIYSDIEYKEDKPSIQVLLKTGFTKEIRIAFKKGQAMKEHKTSYPIVVEICEGKLAFGVNGEVLHLVRGDLLALGPSVPHDLLATEDCVVRLTLTMSDTAKRVEDIVADAG